MKFFERRKPPAGIGRGKSLKIGVDELKLASHSSHLSSLRKAFFESLLYAIVGFTVDS
jgi:hypothetical protein